MPPTREAPPSQSSARRVVFFTSSLTAQVREEIFGPVLQVVRWHGDPLEVVREVNALGYGLTLGIQTRLDARAQSLAAEARASNVYVNRNMVGAVVGVQAFGGEGLSGTGPKSGGPTTSRTSALSKRPLSTPRPQVATPS